MKRKASMYFHVELFPLKVSHFPPKNMSINFCLQQVKGDFYQFLNLLYLTKV